MQVVKGGSCPTQKARPQRRALDSINQTESLYSFKKTASDSKTYRTIFLLNIQERFCPKQVGSIKTKCNYLRGFDDSYVTSDSSAKRDLSTTSSNALKDNSSNDETHHWEKRKPKNIMFCPFNPPKHKHSYITRLLQCRATTGQVSHYASLRTPGW